LGFEPGGVELHNLDSNLLDLAWYRKHGVFCTKALPAEYNDAIRKRSSDCTKALYGSTCGIPGGDE
jgi:hypothetical protein